MLENYPDIMTFKQVQEVLGIGRNLLLNLLNSGELPGIRLGRLWRVTKPDLIKYLSKQPVNIQNINQHQGEVKMAKSDFNYEVTEIIGELTPNASARTEWCKSILRTLMNGMEGIDIRHYNKTHNILGTGAHLSVPEANELVDILLKNGYGSFNVLEETYNTRKKLYSDD